MAVILYNSGETPIVKKHSGFTFQNPTYTKQVLPAQQNDGYRKFRQRNAYGNLWKASTNWRNLSGADQAIWNSYASTYPQLCANPDRGYLSGYELFLKRNSYQALNFGLGSQLMTSPTLSFDTVPTGDYYLVLESGKLMLYFFFDDYSNNFIYSAFLSNPQSPGKKFINSRTRYVGYFKNFPFRDINMGALYNGYCLQDERNMCPPGWHIPTRPEWETLIDFVGGLTNAGYHLKENSEFYWSPGFVALNDFGFNVRGSGYRSALASGGFEAFEEWAGYSFAGGEIDEMDFIYNQYFAFVGTNASLRWGNPVRYIKDDDVEVSQVVGNDGQVYPAKKIGNQVWSTLNSVETKFRTGESIPYITSQPDWSSATSAGFCFYDNDESTAYFPVYALDVTELYLSNFGIMPSLDQWCFISLIPYGASSAQFPEVLQMKKQIIS